jgi:hypothetical protein
VYAGGRLVNHNFNNDSPFDIALWRIPIDQWASLEIHILPPSQLISVTAMPVIQWNVDWEDDLQWSKDRILGQMNWRGSQVWFLCVNWNRKAVGRASMGLKPIEAMNNDARLVESTFRQDRKTLDTGRYYANVNFNL